MLESLISKSVLIGNFLVYWNCFFDVVFKFWTSMYKSVLSQKFPIKTLLEMRDSSIKNPGEAEYDKQN